MDFKHIVTTEVLNIENVELYQTCGHSGDLITEGTLSLLYSEQYDWYILRVNHFNYGISKKIPVLASSQERGAVRAYVVPNPRGYFVIKITRAYNLAPIDKFENILRSTTEFAWKDGQGLPVKFDDHSSVTVKRGAAPEDEIEEQKQTSTAHMIYKGGKATRRMIVGAAQGISNGITRVGGHIHNQNVEATTEEDLVEPKKASKLALFNSATGMATSTNTYYMKGLTSLGNWIGQAIETKLEKRNNEKEIKKIKERTAAISAQTHTITYPHQEGVMGVGFATIYSAYTIWQGMLEALDIIRDGLSETAGGIVTRRYGPVMGEVFRAGVSVAAGGRGEGFFNRRN